jgi:hypothetical protein
MAKKTNPTPAAEAASPSEITFNFTQRDSAPERLVCEAELVFPATGGLLAGMKLVGFSLWKSPEGELYVTFPSRVIGAGDERRYFDYLRAVNGGSAGTKALKDAILAAYRARGVNDPTP